MITQDYRPQKFDDVAGQVLVKQLLKSIAKNPDSAPKSIILQGEYGTGKTTCARIFAKALNCKHSKDGDACGHCELCMNNIENTVYYQEFDSAMIGNVSDIKELKDTFYFDKTLGYKVIVLDEAQLMTPQAQSALLKILEESLSGIFFILCTTHIDKILPTIRSRSLKLRFDLVKDNDIKLNLDKIIKDKEIEINDDTLNLIINRSQGHMRDAHMLLDEYVILGEKEFKAMHNSAKELYYKLVLACLKKDINLVNKIIELLLTFPIYILKSDYEEFVLDIIKTGMRIYKPDNKFLESILSVFRENIFTLIDIINNKKIYDMFTSDKRFQSAMYLISNNILSL